MEQNRFFAALRMTRDARSVPGMTRSRAGQDIKQKSPGSKGLEALEKPGAPSGAMPPERGLREAVGVRVSGRCGFTKEPRSSKDDRGSRKTAATYSPTWWGSTIGDGELNFSVRNGKRWFLTAITAAYST